MEDSEAVQSAELRSTACAECQRRKQKCNRLWPCNHCRKRKVADKCLYNDFKLPVPTDKKRARSSDRHVGTDDEEEEDENGASDGSLDAIDIQTLGYMGGPLLASFGLDSQRPAKTSSEVDWRTPEECPPLKDVLDIFPPRTQMDTLLQFFFNTINNHYYIIYGPKFLEDYHRWWERRTRNKPLSIQWTALLTVICAAVIQHLHVESEAWAGLGQSGTPDELSERFHQLGRTLAQSVPTRRYHLLNIQRLLHSIYWYKAEARFVEAWHDIGAAIQEAQELGLHRESVSDELSDFEREMRRRVWCILIAWDWQFASGLCRPTLIDHTDVDVAQPTLSLENFYPSPLLYMKLQSEVIELLAARFGAPKNVKTPADILRYKEILEQWIGSFPPIFDTVRPDLSRDREKPWITHHRYYIHTMAYLMILNPIRVYMANTYTLSSPADELEVRAHGVTYSLRNLDATTHWANYAHPRDGRFHFIIFSLFDTASVLASAVLKDEENTLPKKDEISAAIQNAVILLRTLAAKSKTAQTSYNILAKIVKRLPRTSQSRSRKRLKGAEVSTSVGTPCPTLTTSPSTIDTTNLSERAMSGYHSDASPPSIFNSSASVGSGSINRSSHGLTPESTASSSEPPMRDNTSPPVVVTQYTPADGHNFVDPSMNSMTQPEINFTGAQHDYTQFGPSVTYDNQVYMDSAYALPTYNQEVSLEPITETDLGDFSRLWDWRTLDFGFIVPDDTQ